MKNLWGISVVVSSILGSGCGSFDPKRGDQDIADVVQEAIEDQVFVEGGSFMMGDIGPANGTRYIGFKEESVPVHEVELSSYSISKYETTWEAFNFYLRSENLIRLYEDDVVKKRYLGLSEDPLSPYFKDKPARTPTYKEAEGFCAWLAEHSGLPFNLPTEAQWEYAARSRGKNIPYATNNGKLEKDPYLYRPSEYIDPSIPPTGNVLTISSLEMERRPVGSYPSNELGLYDMTGNVAEWTRDWFSPDYYARSPRLNPKGPSQPLDPEKREKTVRDWAGHGDTMAGFGTVFNRSGRSISMGGNGFRCVVNQDTPLS